MQRDPYKYFRIEARELLDQLNQAVLELEKATTQDRVAHLLRLAHTLKGAARVVKRMDIGDLAHAVEDALAPLRGSDQQADQPLINAVLGYLDEINVLLASLTPQPPTEAPKPVQPSAVGTPAAPTAPAQPAAPALPVTSAPTTPAAPETMVRTIRIDIGEMDNFLDGFTEVHAQLQALREGLRQSSEIRRQIDQLGVQLATRTNAASVDSAQRSDLREARASAEQIRSALDQFNRSLGSGIEQFDRELKTVRDVAERMRLIRADALFGTLERAARDAAQVRGKKVVFEGRGGETRLDAQVLGSVQDALAHAVRNAVAHGIEAPDARQASGKRPEGHVVIEVAQRGRWITFTCTDDGRGIDLAAVRQIAEEKGLVPPDQARTLEMDAAVQLLFKGGISTAQVVTEVSGRGVGLDVVRDAAERLGGRVDLRTETGRGTSVTLTVPLLIAALDGLLVEVAGVVATIPIEAVRRTLRLAPNEIARTAQGASMIFEGRTIPFLPLGVILSARTPPPQVNRSWSAVVVEANGGAAALGVDHLLGVTNVILRPLPASALARATVSGVSLDLGGNPQLVLDPAQLVIEAQSVSTLPSEPAAPQYTVLVIDDSLTTRMLERSILESAGYIVDLAVSAEEGLEKALHKRYALFLVDVEMPGMDGFTFIEQTQANPDLRDIPAILVTSRASPEDLQRGQNVGARGYVIKSEFDQGVLLARISELVR
ncbi:MAG TPA: response regulator [Phototrophicaceae bacterium]|nr:response regulator [Phototrophicaceae bacterium]